MNLFTPLSIGFIGSLHCLGMCGPIAMALPIAKHGLAKRTFGLFLYNAGRVLTYALMGMIFGFMGKSFHLAGIQRQVSVFLGVLILMGLFIPYVLSQKNKLSGVWNSIFGSLYQEMGTLLKKGSMRSLFVIGFINGFLPCGLVYLAIAGALAQSEIIDGATFMILFGLGTAPTMFSAGWVSKYLSLPFRNKLRKALPVFIGFFGVLLILRGLNLGIYLSPKIDAVGAFIQSCL